MSHIPNNIEHIRTRIREAALTAGRNPGDITLVAVSKRQSIADIEDAYNAGQRHFGENYAQELRDKAVALSHLTDIQWHFIGNLQKNKVKYVVANASMMECIDSFSIAEEFSKRAKGANRTLDALLQVNVGREPQKSGCMPDDAAAIMSNIRLLPNIRLRGLMTVPPFHLEAAETRLVFRELAALRDALGGKDALPELSMGMSHDFEEAIWEGATLVRVGTAIFGERPPKSW
ncbi:MAG: YggS family pyridoxal phosphate-dependent enzyme [Deltaproteobacteria bacterium]|nr:YggS family pyridoxal phosphate-dependent enzyme [Deltaproteobacteria bacterium]MBN2673987.1 YggS family pyridoxal phosphate-dependent enzyme [Deltaproteobacteria bacterium]